MKAFLFLLCSCLPLALPGQNRIPTNPPYPITPEAQILKAEILKISRANQTRTDNLPQVRAQLNPLIQRLVAITPSRTEPEKLYQVLGGWYQVWSDAPFYSPTPIGSYDLGSIYQVVFNGYYWNIAKLRPPVGPEATTEFLRGTFGVTPGSLQPVVFTKDVFGAGAIPPGFDILTFAIRAESGEYDSQPVPGGGPVGFPQSPIIDEYVDDNFRIVTNPPDANGNTSLFVLIRTSSLGEALRAE